MLATRELTRWTGKVPPKEAALRDKKVSSSGRWETGTVEPMFFKKLEKGTWIHKGTIRNIFWVVGSNIFLFTVHPKTRGNDPI